MVGIASKQRNQPRKAVDDPMPEILLRAGPVADVVLVPARTVVSIDGRGEPGAQDFQRSVGALYGVAYTLKFARKRAGNRTFKVGALEACWWAGGGEEGFAATPMKEWRWRLRLAVPGDVSRREVAAAIALATGRKGSKLEGSVEAARVALERVPAGRWGRILHLGPYSQEGPSVAKVRAAIEQRGGVVGADHVEIYLNDPRRTQPRKVRTVLLVGLARPQRGAVQARTLRVRKPAAQELHVPPARGGRPLVR